MVQKNPVLNQVDVTLLKQACQRIQEFDARNPTLEILDDAGKTLLTQL